MFLRAGRSAYHRHITRLKEGISSNAEQNQQQDDYIEKYLAEKELNLTATLDAKTAYADADFVVIAAPTNVYSIKSVAV